MKKIIGFVILDLVVAFAIFVTVECFRLKNNSFLTPFAVFEKTMCEPTNIACYDDDEIYKEEYRSLGFSFIKEYTLDPDSTAEDVKYQLSGAEFMLFYKIRLWAWVS